MSDLRGLGDVSKGLPRIKAEPIAQAESEERDPRGLGDVSKGVPHIGFENPKAQPAEESGSATDEQKPRPAPKPARSARRDPRTIKSEGRQSK
jgi:hypothetical protein